MAKRWTNEEVEYLSENWGNESVEKIAKHLDRKVDAITRKAYKLKLGPCIKCMDGITFWEFIGAVGYKEYGELRRRLIKLGCPIRRKNLNGRTINVINIKSFWKWVEKNKTALSFANFKEGALGKEPDWVNKKRRADMLNPTKARANRRWTIEEDRLLIAKVKSRRYTYKMLAKDLNRTEGAIARRLSTLKVKYRPVPLDNHVFWTEEENKKMIELYKQGYDDFFIAETLNKSQLAIKNRIRIMC